MIVPLTARVPVTFAPVPERERVDVELIVEDPDVVMYGTFPATAVEVAFIDTFPVPPDTPKMAFDVTVQ